MRINKELRYQLEKLLETYELEVRQAQKNGLLTDSTARTYLLHPSNFVKWCKGDFIPAEGIQMFKRHLPLSCRYGWFLCAYKAFITTA